MKLVRLELPTILGDIKSIYLWTRKPKFFRNGIILSGKSSKPFTYSDISNNIYYRIKYHLYVDECNENN